MPSVFRGGEAKQGYWGEDNGPMLRVVEPGLGEVTESNDPIEVE